LRNLQGIALTAAAATATSTTAAAVPLGPRAAATGNRFLYTRPGYRRAAPVATASVAHSGPQVGAIQFPTPALFGPHPGADGIFNPAQQRFVHTALQAIYDPAAGAFDFQQQQQQQQFLSGMGGFSGNPWAQAPDVMRKPVRFPAMAMSQQPEEVQNACYWATNCWPVLPSDRVPGVFSIVQTGEILFIGGPREGEEWMRLNPQEDEQRWSMFKATMLVLGSSRVQADRVMLEQFDSLVQPTQFLEFLQKTMPMNNAKLDMISAMHGAMFRRLNVLDVLFRGGQLAVDAFTTSGLTGVEKRKGAAIASAKKAEPNQPSGKRARQGRDGGGGGYAGQSSNGGGNSSRQSSGGGGGAPQGQSPFQQKPRVQCGKCRKFGHATENCHQGA
jgi:uncharacterized membrane protein YgcG